jgi:dTDP-4-dehydrorhamnose 3,5-epimerase
MKFTKTRFQDLKIIESEKKSDARGYFKRIFDMGEFSKKKLETKFVQLSFSHNKKKGTLRGMHFQKKPFQETKIVQCVKGKIFDVVIDLRPNSSTYKKWFSLELSESDSKMLYIPKGFAHGFLTLENNTEVFYQISTNYNPKYVGRIRWDDEEFKIRWPIKPVIISKNDLITKSFKK